MFTDDAAFLGVYQISIVGSVPAQYMDPVYSEELLIQLNVSDACPDDEVTPTSSIANTLYYIAEDGLIGY